MTREITCPWGAEYYGGIKRSYESRFSYHHLKPELKPAYLTALDAMYRFKSYADTGVRMSDEDVNALSWALLSDNPELFYCRCSAYSQKLSSTRVIFEYGMGRDEVDRYMERIVEVREMLRRSTKGMSDVKKEMRVHDYLAATVRYDLEAPHCYSMVGAIVDKRAVCQGISLAASYLLNSVGVNAGVICGKVTGSEGVRHAWNVVNLDGRNYHVDVTFDETGYRFFNLDDRALAGKRTWNPEIKCSGKRRPLRLVRSRFPRTAHLTRFSSFTRPQMISRAVSNGILYIGSDMSSDLFCSLLRPSNADLASLHPSRPIDSRKSEIWGMRNQSSSSIWNLNSFLISVIPISTTSNRSSRMVMYLQSPSVII